MSFEDAETQFVSYCIKNSSWEKDAVRIGAYLEIEYLILRGKAGSLSTGPGFLLNSAAKSHPRAYRIIENELLSEKKSSRIAIFAHCLLEKLKRKKQLKIPYKLAHVYVSKTSWLLAGGKL